MSALGDKGITLEGLAAAVDSLRQELATWKALARKQDALSADQITATQSGATAAKISQIAVNTAAIQSLAAQVAGQISLEYVTTLPATGEPLTLYLVPQGDGTAPNYCNEYLWINNAWELIGTTGAMANNGELVIQVNGVAVGTFTANQAANSTVNIAVPTNTNQLVNGAQFVDAAALQAALLLKQNSLNASQLEAVNSGITAAAVQQIADNATAIGGKQDALTTAQQAAVDSGATAAKIDQIASNASAIVSLTSSKQDSLSTTQLVAVNSGVTAAAVQQIGTNTSNISSLQTAVSGKAEDADVVHLAGAETITGEKTWTGWNTFSGKVTFTGTEKIVKGLNTVDITQTSYSENISQGYFTYQDAITRYFGGFGHRVETDGTSVFIFDNSNFTTGGTQGVVTLRFEYRKDFSYSLCCGGANLGNATRKWKTLNGINPGALSTPNLSASSRVDISGNMVADSYGNIKFTPQIYGWVYIDFNVTSATITSGTEMCVQAKNNSIANTDFAINFMRQTDSYHVFVWMPVWANKQIILQINFSGFSVGKAYIYPCQGNV